MKISEEQIEDGILLSQAVNPILEDIWKHVQTFLENDKSNLDYKLVQSLDIDMIGKMVTFPGVNKQEELNYICKWIKHRYEVDLKIKAL